MIPSTEKGELPLEEASFGQGLANLLLTIRSRGEKIAVKAARNARTPTARSAD
jgi:hypothetical protein